MNKFKTIKLDGKDWLKLTKTQAARLGLEHCWSDGLLVNCDGYYTGMTDETIWYNCHPEGRTPVCDGYTWWKCSVATDELIDALVASQINLTTK